MNLPLSVIIITKDEEQNIHDCLQSVQWADEIILVDAMSADRTVEIARQFTQNIFVKEWMGFAAAKQFALDHATNDWVLWIDADERVTERLAEEIQYVITTHSDITAYRVARRAYFLGKWIKHCGWYPGYAVRLFRRVQARFSEHHVHEHIQVEGSIGTMRQDLLHLTDRSIEKYFSKYNHYTSLAANGMFQSGRKAHLPDILFRPMFIFIKMYFLRLGFLDGMHGFLLCCFSASYVLTKYAKLWEKQIFPASTAHEKKS